MSAFTWLNIEKYNKRPNKYFIILMILFAAFSCFIFTPKKNWNVFFLHWLLKILVSNHCVIRLKLVFDLASFNHRDFMIFFSKVSLFKKNDVFVVDLYCSPIFMNIQFDTLHIHHMHDAQQKKTHTNWSQLSFKTTNIYWRRKKTLLGGFFRGFYFTIYRGLCVCLCVCLRCLYCMPYTVSVELMHDLTVNIVQTVCCLCSVQYLLTECIDAYLPARLCVWNCKKIEMNSKRFVAGI